MSIDEAKSVPRLKGILLSAGILTLCFTQSLWDLLRLALNEDLYSYVLLVPAISAYLVWVRRGSLPRISTPARSLAAWFFAGGAAVIALAWLLNLRQLMPGGLALLALEIFSLLLFFTGLCAWFLGREVLRALAFPLAMLIFMIPLPGDARQGIEAFLQQGSAAVAGWFFELAGTPVLPDGLRVQLPGITLQVAAECSGIHSSLVLLITSLLAGNLFLRNPWNRAILALVVIPLALLRNGFRIFVIGELCAHLGPEMINSQIHRHGGPLFFALSLLPLFGLLFYFRKIERSKNFQRQPQENSMKQVPRVTITLVLAGFLAITGAGCTARVKTAWHLQRANKYFAASQFPQAEVEYINVLRNDRQNPVAIGRLGLIYFEEGRDQRAAPFLIRGGELATNDLNLQLKLGMISQAMGKIVEARAKAGFVLDHNPGDEDAPVLLARASLTPKDISAARARLQKMAQTHDTSAIEVGLGTLAITEHDFKSASAAFLQAQRLDPKSATAASALGEFYLAQNNLKSAEASFKSAAELSPSRSFRRVQYAQFEAQIGNVAAARLALTELTKTVPDYVPAWVGLVEISLSEKKYDEAKTFFDSAQARDPGSYDMRLLEARVDLARGETARAKAELTRMAADYPRAAGVHYQLALACLAGNEVAPAVESLKQAVNLQPEFTDAVLLLAQIQIKNGAPDQAADLLKKLSARQPQNLQAQLLLADADRALGNFESALAIYHQLEQSRPRDPQISLLLGSTYWRQNNLAAARQAFTRTLALAPDNTTAAEQLVDLDLSGRQFADAGQLVTKLIGQHPRQAGPLLLQAHLFQAQGKTNQAESALLAAIKVEPTAPDACLLLAQLYADSGQNQKALAQLEAVLKACPQNPSALMLLATVHERSGDYQAAAAAYEKVLAINPQYGPALNNLAYDCTELPGRLERAHDLAQQARNLLPTDPATADTLGWVLCKQGQYPAAISLLQEAAAKLPDEPSVQFHLGMAHYLMGEVEPARVAFQSAVRVGLQFPGSDECRGCLAVLAINPQVANSKDRVLLENRIAQNPADLIALSCLALIYQRQGDDHQAAGAYETLLKIDPRNGPAMAGLAEVDASNNPEKAFQLAKAASELNPDDQKIACLAGRLGYRTGHYQWAYNLLQPAVRNQPANAGALFDFAGAAYSLGKISEAQAAMQSALSAGLDSSQTDEARNFLNLTALAAHPAQAVAAESQVEIILKSQPDYVPALVTLAVIESQESKNSLAEETYEKVLSHYPDFSPAQKELAVLYAEDGGKLPRARALAIKAGEAYPNDNELTRALGVIAFHQNDFAESARLLQASLTEGAGDAELFYDLGIAEFRLKNPAQSRDALHRALELKPAGQQATEATQILAQLK